MRVGIQVKEEMGASSLLMTTAVLVGLFVATVAVSGQEDRTPGRQEGRGTDARPAAGPVPRKADGKPDLTGTWIGTVGMAHTVILEAHAGGFGVTAGKGLITDPADGVIPYQPWALEERNRRRDDANGYEDPVGHCEYYDIGRVHSFAQQIQYTDEAVIIHANREITRVVDMKRSQHLPDGIRLWNGDPIGRWEGDTLVIDTTNFNGRTRMSIGGDFYGLDARVVERLTMLDANTYRWTMTIDSPSVFTRPWTMTSALPMSRMRAGGPAPGFGTVAQGPINFDDEDTCHEGNVPLVHLKNTFEQAHGPNQPWVKDNTRKP
jgi:hypothetical protein